MLAAIASATALTLRDTILNPRMRANVPQHRGGMKPYTREFTINSAPCRD